MLGPLHPQGAQQGAQDRQPVLQAPRLSQAAHGKVCSTCLSALLSICTPACTIKLVETVQAHSHELQHGTNMKFISIKLWCNDSSCPVRRIA